MSQITPPLKWHGGKHYLAPKIIALMPPHIHYVEPYFGGGAVLLAKDPEGISEVANDLNSTLTYFWGVLQDSDAFMRFRREIEATPFSEEEYRKAAKRLDDRFNHRAWWEKARDFFIVCRQSLAGRMKGFASLSRTRTRRGMNEQASAWMTAVEGLPAVHARLMRVAILNRTALEVIEQQDGEGTLFYLDPPYLHETRKTIEEYGENEMSAEDHGELLELLGRIKGKFLLSGYRSDLYDDWAKACGWNRHEFTISNNASGAKEKPKMTECVWANF